MKKIVAYTIHKSKDYDDEISYMEGVLIDYADVSEETIDAIEGIYGRNEKNLSYILSYFTGYDDFDEFMKSELNIDVED